MAKDKIVWDSQPNEIQWDEPIKAPAVPVIAKVPFDAGKETARAAAQGLTLGFADEIEAAFRTGQISGQQYQQLRNQLRAQQESFAQEYPKTAIASEVAGSLLTPGGIFAKATKVPGIAKSALIGAGAGGIQGAGKSTDSQQLATDILYGSEFGGVGGAALGTLGAAIAPRVQPSARKLQQEGVELTPGAAFGGNVQAFEQASESVPIVGNLISGARQQSFESFNRAAYNKALKEIDPNVKVPSDLPARQAADFTYGQISSKYNEIYPNVSLKYNKNLNNQFDALGNRYKNKLPEEKYNQFTNQLDSIKTRLENKTVTGGQIKALKEDLRLLTDAYKGTAGSEKLLGDAYGDLENSIMQTIRNQNPKYSKDLKKADTAYATYKRAEAATSAAKGTAGTFTPAQLETAVKSGNKSQYARGQGLLQDLSGAGYDVLGNKIPDSGTVTRGGIASLLTGGAYQFLDPLSAFATGTGSLLYTKPGMKYAMPLLTAPRPQAVQQYGSKARAALPYAVPGFGTLGGLLKEDTQ